MENYRPRNAARIQFLLGSRLNPAFLLILLVIFIGLALAVVTVAYAQTPLVSLTVTPDSIALNPGQATQVLVIANIPSTTIQSITLTAYTDAGAAIRIQHPSPGRPLPQGDLLYTLTITRTDPGSPAGKIYLRASYLSKTPGGQLVHGLSTASLEIQDRAQEAMQNVVTASLETALDSIQDRQSRQVFVVVNNISPVPVTVTGITVSPIPDITARVQDLGSGYPLSPQQTHPFSITVTAGGSIQSGKHLLVVQVDAEWTLNGQHMAGSTVLNKDFQAGVFGESAILQATGIPSLMLLPGFLFLITLTLTVKWTWKKSLLDLEFKKPEFWYTAITLSLLTVWLYPSLTGPFLSWLLQRPMSSHDLLQAYGFDDILLLWLGAVVFGLLVWAVVSTVLFVGLKIRQDREQRKHAMLVPALNDPPLVVLRKIANNQKGLDLEQKKYSRGDASQLVFVVPTAFPEQGKIWVIPRIQIHWLNATDQMKDDFDGLLGNPQSIRQVIQNLTAWQDPNNPVIDLDWDKKGPLIYQLEQVDENKVTEITPTGDSLFTFI